MDVSLNTDSTNPKFSDGNTAQANSADDSPVDASDSYLTVDTPADNSPVDVPGVPETSKIPNKDHTESEKNLTVRRDEVTNVAEIQDAPVKGREQQPEIEEEQNLSIPLRRSSRQRGEPEILTYFQRGNPLSYVVQSLFQGLSTAFVNSLNGVENPSALSNLPDASPNVVTNQPHRACKGACMISGRETVTLVK